MRLRGWPVVLGLLLCLTASAAPAWGRALTFAQKAPLRVSVTKCPIPPPAVPVSGFAPVPATTVIPSSISLPPGVRVFGTGNVGTFTAYSLGPSTFTCSAIGAGADGGFGVTVSEPASHHSIDYDYNPGGAGPNTDAACPYIPAAEAADVIFRNGSSQFCARPGADAVTQVATGVPDVKAAIVQVPPTVKDVQILGAGDGHDETVAVFLVRVVAGAVGVEAQNAECTLPASQRPVCLAALEFFVTQSLAAREVKPIFAALTAALAVPGAPPGAVAGRSWSISPTAGIARGAYLTVSGTGCVVAATAPGDLEVSVGSRSGTFAYFRVSGASGHWGGRFRAPRAPPGGRSLPLQATCETDHGVSGGATATPAFVYRHATALAYRPAPGAQSAIVPSRSALSDALPGRTQVPMTIRAILKSLGVAVLLVMLVGFPAEIFNRALEENYAEVRGWFRRLRPPARLKDRLAVPPLIQFAVFCVVAALLSMLVDPEIIFREPGWPGKGILLFVGFFVAIPVTTLIYAVPGERYARQVSGGAARLRALPFALLIAAAFVAISLAGRLMPGYVYGLVAGYGVVHGRKLTRQYEGFAVLLGALFVLAASLLIWVLWEPVRVAAAGLHPSWPVLALDAVMSQTVILGLEAIVFALLPMQFLDGGKLRRWSLRAWAPVYLVAAFFFVHLLVLNARPVAQAQHQHDVSTVFALFIGFALFSCAFWGYFRFRPTASEQTGGGIAGAPESIQPAYNVPGALDRAQLARVGGKMIVRASSRQDWPGVKGRLCELLGTAAGSRLDLTVAELRGVAGEDLDRARAEQATIWQVRLADLLDEHPSIGPGLAQLTGEINATDANAVTPPLPGDSAAQETMIPPGRSDQEGRPAETVPGEPAGPANPERMAEPATRLSRQPSRWILAAGGAALIAVVAGILTGVPGHLLRPARVRESIRPGPDIIVRADLVHPAGQGSSMVVPGAYRPAATLAKALSHPMAADSQTLLRQIRNAGAISIGQIAIRLQLQDNRNQKIQILKVRTANIEHKAPPDGVLFYIPPQGAGTSHMDFNLDQDSPAALTSAGGASLLNSKPITLTGQQRQVLQIQAFAWCSRVSFDLAIDYQIGTIEKTEIVSGSNGAFEVTGYRIDADRKTITYRQEYQIQSNDSLLPVDQIKLNGTFGCPSPGLPATTPGLQPVLGSGTVPISITPSAAAYPHARSIVKVITQYFRAINRHNYRLYRPTQSLSNAISPQQFATGFRSTKDSAVTILGISAAKDRMPTADVTFTSHQQPQDGPSNEPCTQWDVMMFLEKTGATYIITHPPASYHAKYQACA